MRRKCVLRLDRFRRLRSPLRLLLNEHSCLVESALHFPLTSHTISAARGLTSENLCFTHAAGAPASPKKTSEQLPRFYFNLEDKQPGGFTFENELVAPQRNTRMQDQEIRADRIPRAW